MTNFQESSDLKNWHTLGQANETSNGSFGYRHPTASESAQRFYRIVEE